MAKKKYARCFVGAALAAAVMMPGIAFASDDTQGANVHEQQCELSQEAIERSSRDDAWSFNFTFLGATALWFMWMALRMATATVELTVRNTVRQQ